MIYAGEADIIIPIRSIVEALQPYAATNQVSLRFQSTLSNIEFRYQPFHLIKSISNLLCEIINLVPDESEIVVRVKNDSRNDVLIEIENTKTDLTRVNGLCSSLNYNFKSISTGSGTLFRLILKKEIAPIACQDHALPPLSLKPLYSEVQKRLRWHFTQAEKLVAALEHSRPEEARFLHRFNSLISANLHDAHFDTQSICRSMSLSRTQLFRRVKPLIRQAPANYIKTIRLQKAKELLETTDLTVGEVADKTGFLNQSHFTNIFQKKYGVLPSLFRRGKKPATNE